MVALLEAQPAEKVREIGFGPGLAIAQLSRRVGDTGHVYGIDHSDVKVARVPYQLGGWVWVSPRGWPYSAAGGLN